MLESHFGSGTMKRRSAKEETPVLEDFDWKLKYAVSSDSLATVNKPLLRLELAMKKPEIAERKIQVLVAEYTKAQLDGLITQMEAITKELDRMAAEGST